MAEGQGFEPWVGYKPTSVFKTGAFGRSATPPKNANLTEKLAIVNGIKLDLSLTAGMIFSSFCLKDPYLGDTFYG